MRDQVTNDPDKSHFLIGKMKAKFLFEIFSANQWGKGFLLVFLTVMAYLPALHGGFVWDDTVLVTGNHSVQSADGLWNIWFSVESPDYYPVTYSVFWAEWRLWGMNPPGYHAVGLFLHSVTAILMWRILLRLKIPGAWLAALLFALHPVNVASVAWIAELKNTLSGVLFASALIFYLRFDSEDKRQHYWLALLLFCLALLSKTSVVILPVILLLIIWWQRSRIDRTDIVRTIPFFAVSCVMGAVTVWFQNHNVIGDAAIPLGGIGHRTLTAASAASFYIWKALFPINLSMLYPKWKADHALVRSFLSLILLSGVAGVGIWFRKTWGRGLLFGTGYFLVCLFPVLGFFRMYYFRLSAVADHWQYLAIMGIVAMATAGSATIVQRLGFAWFGKAAAVCVVVFLMFSTWSRAHVLKDAGTLWTDVLRGDPDSWTAHTNIACVYQQDRRFDDALTHARRAVELEPDDFSARLNLGTILEQNGQPDSAIVELKEAIRQKPDLAAAYLRWGIALAQKRMSAEAIGRYEVAVRLQPDYPDTYNNLGAALEGCGRIDQAARCYRAATNLKPDYVDAHNNLGNVLYKQRKVDEALEQFRESVRLNPNSADAHNNLGGMLYLKGNIDGAIAQFQEALKFDPNHAGARRNLNAMLAMKQR